MKDRPVLVIRVSAPNDGNGNPRHLYLAMDKVYGDCIGVFEEGYRGYPEELKGGGKTEGVTIVVTLSEYKSWVQFGRDKGCYYDA